MKTIILLLIATIAYFFFTYKSSDNSNPINISETDNIDIPNDVQLFYKGKPVQITKHAQCRMDCRFINNKEIMEILLQDNINHKKTQSAQGNKCPSFAYEGNTSTGKKLRIVMADCEDKGKLVTVIDLKTDFECTCN